MPDRVYDVYLVPSEEQESETSVVSPVTGEGIDFYDSGVWLERESGRNFFPYRQVRTIRERSADDEREQATGDERLEAAGQREEDDGTTRE